MGETAVPAWCDTFAYMDGADISLGGDCNFAIFSVSIIISLAAGKDRSGDAVEFIVIVIDGSALVGSNGSDTTADNDVAHRLF